MPPSDIVVGELRIRFLSKEAWDGVVPESGADLPDYSGIPGGLRDRRLKVDS